MTLRVTLSSLIDAERMKELQKFDDIIQEVSRYDLKHTQIKNERVLVLET